MKEEEIIQTNQRNAKSSGTTNLQSTAAKQQEEEHKTI